MFHCGSENASLGLRGPQRMHAVDAAGLQEDREAVLLPECDSAAWSDSDSGAR